MSLPDGYKLYSSCTMEPVSFTQWASSPMIAEYTSSACPDIGMIGPRTSYEPSPPRYLRKNAYISLVPPGYPLLNPVKDLPKDQSLTMSVCAHNDNMWTALVVRRFANPNCPVDERVAGSDMGLTGWIITFPKSV
jgi:hypothetical protein